MESEGQTGVLQLEQIVIVQRVLFEPCQLVKEAHAANTFAEEATEHAVLRPNVPVLGRNVLDDVVGGGADNILGGICLRLGNAGGADVLLEELDGVGALLHQASE